MMNASEQLDQDDQGAVAPGVMTSPIVIVQRGRSTWGRELLLLLLLVATIGYIFYQEYRGPSIIVRTESPGPSRSVDAVPIPTLASGSNVVRAERSNLGDEESPEPSATTPARRIAPQDEAIPATGPTRIAGLGDDPGNIHDEPLSSDDSVTLASEDQARIAEESVVEQPISGTIPPEDSETEPRRSTHEIVWDLDRRDRPPNDPVPAEEPIMPRGSDDGWESGPVRKIDREPSPQTIAERRHFQQCLARAIRQYGRDAGPHIEGLCRDFRIPLPSQVVQLERQYGTNLFIQGADLERTVTVLRSIGAPESYLLEQLGEQMSKAIGVRRGPRDHMEARVFAARKLLSIPLPTPDPDRAAIIQ